MSDRFSKPSSVWRYVAPPEVSAGDLLPEELLSDEAAFGPTEEVLHAYATRLGAQWDDQLAAFVPLGLAAGRITAAAVYAPLFVPGLQYVQAESVEVCALYAPHVPWLKVNSREAIEALAAAPGCVTRVDAFGVAPFEVDAPFELRWLSWSEDRAPHWFRRWTHRPFYAQLAPLGDSDWLCWDLDHRKVVSVRDEGCHAAVGVHLGDIFPQHVREGTLRHAGAGWAANAEEAGTYIVAADGRRFLACNEHERGVRQLVEIWRARKPFSEMSEGSHATFASVEFDDADAQRATLQWIGRFRVLRIRRGRLEQLTRDHDMRWLMEESGELAPEEIPDDLPRNIIGKSLPLGAPDTATVEVEPGDRFVLLPAQLQELLEQAGDDLAHALTRGTVAQVARWIRAVATAADVHAVAVVLDANAHAAWAHVHAPPLPPLPLRRTTVMALVQQPAEFADQRIAARGVFHCWFERMQFADAWFRCSPDLPRGAWLVDVEGTWRHGGQYGHFGLSASELIGTATLVAIDRPRRVAPTDARHERHYVPLTSTATVHQGLQGWRWERQWLNRVGPDTRLPAPDQPQEVDLELTYFIDGWRNIGVFSWRELARRALEPTPAMVTDRLERGAYVQLRGYLTAPRVLEWPNDARGPYAEWPLLDGKLRVIPPAIARTADRHATPKLAQLQPLVDAIGDGVFVVVVAEVAHDTLWATSIVGPNGAIDVDIL